MRCPNCNSIKLSWDSFEITTVPPTGNTIAAPKMVLGCDECSETVKTIDLGTVANLMNNLKILITKE